MSDEPQRWIVIPQWHRFQHYRDRQPPWIKAYTTLLSKDEYLDLSFHARGVLHGLWIAYAASGRQLVDNTSALSRQLGGRVTRATLDSLNQAGFIEFSASRPLALARSRREVSKETSKERVRASDQQAARTPTPEQNNQPFRAAPDEPEVDPEAAAKIRALAATIGIPLRAGRPEENGAREPDDEEPST